MRKRGHNESEESASKMDELIPNAASKKIEAGGEDMSRVKLKSDHASRPIWVLSNGHIFLERESHFYSQANDFLITIAEPISRPLQIHEYSLTSYSLYAAVSVGLDTNEIITFLERLCKTELPASVVEFVTACTLSYGKVKLVLKHNKYYVESHSEKYIARLTGDKVVAECVYTEERERRFKLEERKKGVKLAIRNISTNTNTNTNTVQTEEVLSEKVDGLNIDKESGLFFRVLNHKLEDLQKRCIELDYPLLSEYDFANDPDTTTLSIDLKPISLLRPYQQKSLSKMFGNGRARSGVIVLPCGAGKSLVGVAAASTIKKRTLVLCTSGVSVEQWRSQFLLWSTLSPECICRFTATSTDARDANKQCHVAVTTYSMLAHTGKRSFESSQNLEFLQSKQWGLMLLDEVHTIPARQFRRVLSNINAHCKLGLTATLVREDDKIQDLNFLIGPKLYEANWMDLQNNGYIARVQCAEVWCPMTAEFYAEYLLLKSRRKQLLYLMNPNKFRACQYLIAQHEKRNDKIIVFSDNVYALKHYAGKLNKPYIYGPTSQQERMQIINDFVNNPLVNTVFISKVGDTSFDMPEANVLIQISSHGGSRRQEAQRLGRILRAKRESLTEKYNAFFYNLISKDTEEVFFAAKRQRFLANQGYAYKVIANLESSYGPEDNLFYGSKAEQKELLGRVLAASDRELFDEGLAGASGAGGKTKKSLKSLSGAQGTQYVEYRGDKKKTHALFKKAFNSGK